MTYKEIIREVASAHGLSVDFVDSVYRSYWRAVKDHISSLPLMDDLSDDEFNSLQTNVNIPSIGKLYVTLDRYKRMKQSSKDNKQKKNNQCKNE